MQTLLHTIAMRPYVFVFLAAFLFLSIRRKGLRTTLFFLASGYFIAWASEASSIRNGFPYGWYFYRYENLQGEWMNWGVPVWDSLSYTFLCFAGLGLAEFWKWGAISPQERSQKLTALSAKQLFLLALTGGILTTLIDVVVDPLAHQGDKWFLGDIYYYQTPGFYFGVPMSNFLGWVLVTTTIIAVNLVWEKYRRGGPACPPGQTHGSAPTRVLQFADRYGCVLLYFGAILFNWAITIWIGDYILAAVDVLVMAYPVWRSLKAVRIT